VTLSIIVETNRGFFHRRMILRAIRFFGAGALSVVHGEIVVDQLGCSRNRAGNK
jgi:hypothetical protein